eukprot:m.77248 g.77248  ORF g.77248 m.77248 type:complete len:1254 (+) comp9120_c0_seq3:265-4026(+)
MKGVSTRGPPPLSAIKIPGARRVYLARGPDGFGFRLSTNAKTLEGGYSHYASEVDNGGLAEIAGLKVGDRFLEIDGRSVVSIPHPYLKAVFGRAEINSRPLRCVVCPPNESILASIHAKRSRPTPVITGVETPSYHPEPPAAHPPLDLDEVYPRAADKDGCHLVLLADGAEIAIDAAEAEFGTQLPDDGLILELFHDPTNPTASRPALGGDGRAVMVLLEQGSVVTQAIKCQSAGALACVFVNRKADQRPQPLAAGEEDGERVTIPCVNISMRDGIALAKRLRAGPVAITAYPWTSATYDESDIGTVISDHQSQSERQEDEMNPGLIVKIDGEDVGTMFAGEAEFGDYLPASGVTLEVVTPNDPRAATRFDADEARRVRGKVVLVERGGLKIAQKVLHCEQAGARACIVANTTPNGQAFNIARTEDGGPEDHVGIPTLAIGTDDGQRLAEAVADGQRVEVTMHHYLPEGPSLPEGWVADEQPDGTMLYVNEERDETLATFPTPEAVAEMRFEKRQAALEARERELEAEAERLAAVREQEKELERRAAELEEREARLQAQAASSRSSRSSYGDEVGDAVAVLDSLVRHDDDMRSTTQQEANPFGPPPTSASTTPANPFAAFAGPSSGDSGTDGDDGGDTVEVQLTKSDGEKWGIKLRQEDDGLYLKETPSSTTAAGRPGVLRGGMLIVSVNGTSTLGFTKKELAPHMKTNSLLMVAQRGAKNAGDGAGLTAEEEVALAVQRAEEEFRQAEAAEAAAEAAAAAAAAAAATSSTTSDDGTLLVTINKQSGQKLGLKIGNKGGTNAVKKVLDGGLASSTAIKPGMVLVSVNGASCQGLGKDECVALLSSSGTLSIRLREANDNESGLVRSSSSSKKSKSGGVIPIGVDPRPEWLHGRLERGDCDTIMARNGTDDGRFLVRERQKEDSGPVSYGLAVTFRGKATHHKLKLDGDGNIIIGSSAAYPAGAGSKSLAELVEFLSSITVPDDRAPGWPVKLLCGVRADGSLMQPGWTRAGGTSAGANGGSSGGHDDIEAKYAGMKRLAMVKECKSKGIDYSAVAKDEEGLRRLLIANARATGTSDDVGADDSVAGRADAGGANADDSGVGVSAVTPNGGDGGMVRRSPGSILRSPLSPSKRSGSNISWKADEEIVDVETVPRRRNDDEETDQYALYTCRYAYNNTIEGFTEGEDLAIEPGDILQVYDEGGAGGLPQTPEEKEEDPNCWMRGWTQDEREGTFPASYVAKFVPRGPITMDSYGS